MDMKQVLQDRLNSLGISQYELTRRIAAKRNAQGGDTSTSKIQSSIYQALKEPDSRRYAMIEEIVKAMGGEIVIRWTSIEEVKVAS
jgi:hypothetical protein